MEKANLKFNHWDARHKWWHSLAIIIWRAGVSAVTTLIGLICLFAGIRFWQLLTSPLQMIVSLPFLTTGFGLTLVGLIDFLEILFNPKTRRGICPFCGPVKPRNFFVPKILNKLDNQLLKRRTITYRPQRKTSR